MNKLKSSKMMLVLSVLLVLVMIGSVSAADEAGNETVSTSNSDVDTVSLEEDSVDEEVSTADSTEDLVVNDTDNQKGLLSSDNDEDILQEVNVDVSTYDELKNELSSGNKIINIMQDIDFGIQIPITVSNITINGNGYTFKQTSDRFFIVYNAQKIVFKNINFKDGYKYRKSISTYDTDLENMMGGGAIDFRGSKWCTVEFCNFTNCRSVRGGGAIHFQKSSSSRISSDMLITNCNFYNNEAGRGGAIRGPADGITRINITNCYFESNKASVGEGGAIQWKFSYSILDNCTFVNNAGPYSGAIGLTSNGRNSHFINSIFINNYATSKSDVNVGALNIYSTDSPNCVVDNCTFIGNHAPDGGAFHTKANNATLQDCIFINNYATGNDGATGNGGAVLFSADNSKLINCNFTNNTAKYGGAVMFSGQNNNMIDCTFINNIANEGGAVKFNGDYCEMINCSYINNIATVDGGGLCSQATGSVIDGCSFSGNSASKGSDFYGHGNPITFRNMFFTSLWLTNSNYTTSDPYNHTLSYGFGTSWDQPARWDENVSAFLKKNTHCTIYLVGTINNLTHNVLNVSNLDIVGESPLNPNAGYIDLSGWNSSGFIVNASEVTFSKLTFRNANLSDGNGGAIRILGNTTVIDSCTFVNNTAVNGSAVCFESGIVFLIRNSTFIDNHAVNGTVYMHKDAESTLIYSSTFRNNTAYLGGGVFYAGPVWYYIDGATFQSSEDYNNATYNATISIVSAYDKNGTFVFTGFDPDYNKRARLCIDTVYVSLMGLDGNPHAGDVRSDPTDFNTALSMVAPNGKIIFVNSTETWNMNEWYSKQNYINFKYNVTIIGNDTRLVGFKFTNRVYAYDVSLSGFNISNDDGCVVWQARNGTVTNCSFTSKNTVAFIVEGENMTIVGSSFVDNANGALKVDNVGLMLRDCTFDNNTLKGSSNRGSHIFMTGNAINTVIINSTFTNGTNTGIFVNAAGVRIVGSNFTDNKGTSGAALILMNGDLVLTDDTFIRNNATGNGGALYLDKGKVSEFANNTFVNNTAGNDGGAVYTVIVLTVDDSSFIGNDATRDGGAIYTTNNIVILMVLSSLVIMHHNMVGHCMLCLMLLSWVVSLIIILLVLMVVLYS